MEEERMQIQSAQQAQFSGSDPAEQTIVLKSESLYSGLRISCVGSGTHHQTNMLDALNSLTIDVPEYGARSRRVDVDSNTKWMLPIMAQLGALDQADATAATSIRGDNGANNVSSFAYIDLPINKLNLDEDIRVTLNVTACSGGSTGTQTFTFSFLPYAFRPVYFRPYYHSAADSSVQQWFPSDGTLVGNLVITGDGSGAGGSVYEARSSANITQVSLNGEQNTTFTFTQLLAPGLDEAISGSGAVTYAAIDSYSMLKDFPITSGAQYIDVTRGASKELYILGVMTDA